MLQEWGGERHRGEFHENVEDFLLIQNTINEHSPNALLFGKFCVHGYSA